jgi:hypothetical protein
MVEQWHELEVNYPGLEHVVLQYSAGMPLAEFKDQLRRLGEAGMPELTKTSAVAADEVQRVHTTTRHRKGVVTRPSPHPEMTKNVSGHGASLGPFRLFS